MAGLEGCGFPAPPNVVKTITLQTLQSLQQGQQGHLLLKTENGQYQLLRVGPAPVGGGITASQPQGLRLSTVPPQTGVATVSTNIATPVQISAQIPTQISAQIPTQIPGQIPTQIPAQLPSGPVVAPVINPVVAVAATAQSATPQHTVSQPSQPPTVTTQKPSDNTKEKCRNFLANLLDLSSKEPKAVGKNVRSLIQELIDAQVEPEEFCNRLERLLNASPQPCLIRFLKRNLPLLRQSLVNKELVIEGINPPPAHVAFSTVPTPTQQVITNANMQVGSMQRPAPKPGSTIAVLQNIPLHSKINVGKVGKIMTVNSKGPILRPSLPATAFPSVITPATSLLKEKEKKTTQLATQPYVDDKMAGDDDINDVAAMGGVNLAEESQRILGSTDMIGSQIRSCKDEFLIPLNVIMAKIRVVSEKFGLGEPPIEVAELLSHAVHERLKNLVEKLAIIAQHRIDNSLKTDDRYEVTQDVKAQLKFLEERDRVVKRRHEESERELLLRAAKSRSKNEDPEQAKLKAKAKELQRAELEEVRQREANVTALEAIGPRKKSRVNDGAATSGGAASTSNAMGEGAQAGRSQQLPLRSRIKRVNFRDMLFLMENEKQTSRSLLLYLSYLK